MWTVGNIIDIEFGIMWTQIWNNYLGLESFGYEENSYYGLGLYWDDAWSSSGMMEIGIWIYIGTMIGVLPGQREVGIWNGRSIRNRNWEFSVK